MKTVVLAIGGNSLITDKEHQTVPDQYSAAASTCAHIAGMLKDGDLRLVVTHGNGPQVGFILRRAELALHELHMVPLDSCVADTQGALGYHIQRALQNEFKRRGIKRTAVTVVTQVLVDKQDPSFKNPNKPIGSFMDKEVADRHRTEDHWDIVEDAGRGWRRVVASPVPQQILELATIRSLAEAGTVVVAVGGGGIPVVADERGVLTGASAVIDKDLASSLLAQKLGADTLIISTAVEKVCLDFGKPNQRAVSKMTVSEAKRYIAEGHFKAGSMLPKVKAVIEFLENGGTQAIITNPENLEAAVAGRAGTRVVRG